MLKIIKKIGLVSIVIAGATAVGVSGSLAAGGGDMPPLKKYDWPHAGPFGKYDKASLQRGFQVFREVCAACHGMKLVAFRNLADLGYNEDEIKAFAKEYDVTDGPDGDGEMFDRPARPSDYYPSPYANEQAARAANNGAYPPDFSLLAKAREHISLFTPWNSQYGEDYIVNLMTGYRDEPPADMNVEMSDGMNFNMYFPGHQIAMAQPMYDDQVEYADGTPATLEQMAIDVAAFMYWAAEPKLEERKQMGLKVMLFMALLTVLLYFTNKQVWAKVKKGEDLKED